MTTSWVVYIKTTKPFQQFSFKTNFNENQIIEIDWGNGIQNQEFQHVYKQLGIYSIKISELFLEGGCSELSSTGVLTIKPISTPSWIEHFKIDNSFSYLSFEF